MKKLFFIAMAVATMTLVACDKSEKTEDIIDNDKEKQEKVDDGKTSQIPGLEFKDNGLDATSTFTQFGAIVNVTATFKEHDTFANDTICKTFIVTITFPSENFAQMAYGMMMKDETILNCLEGDDFTLAMDENDGKVIIIDLTSPMVGARKHNVIGDVIDPSEILAPFMGLMNSFFPGK